MSHADVDMETCLTCTRVACDLSGLTKPRQVNSALHNMSSATHRPSTHPALPAVKPTCNIDPSAVIADKAVLSGSHNVHIGSESIIQPYARLKAHGGDITIGSSCTIAEAVTLEVPEGSDHDIVLADNVCIESGVSITAASIGEGTEIGIQARIDSGAIIGKARLCYVCQQSRC